MAGTSPPPRFSPDVAILLVEDDPDYREVTLLALRDCCDPARIVALSDGVEALDYLFGRGAYQGRDTRKQPRLVVLDMKLTLLHGLDVLRAMRADPITQSVPVVALSGSTEKEDLDNCYAAGANSVMRKGGDFEELRRKMQRMYEFWLTVNEANRPSRV